MKAVIFREFGSPDVLRCEELPTPAPADDRVLIRVCASSVNPLDWHLMRGRPYFVRMMAEPKPAQGARLGVDVAGIVEAIGKNVTDFQPGDAVFGGCSGAFAEYVCAPASSVVSKPETLTFEQAGAVTVAAMTALQGVRNHGRV